MKTTVLLHGAFLLLLLSPASALPAQERASLEAVEILLAQGKIPEAREVLESWWEEEGAEVDRMERQRSLWLRARLTVDPSMAESDLRRLVLEFPGGPFSDGALFRLAQSAELQGDLFQAYTHYGALLRGYPSSRHRPAAEAWLEANGARAEAMEAAASTRESGGVDEASDPGGGFSVQLGAFRNMEGARSLAESLRSAGYDPRLVRVPGDRLIRVRVGRFQSREGADELKRTMEGQNFDATIVMDAQSEERVG